MTNNTDAQIAREWERRAVDSAENAQPVSRGALAAARHILATTTPPTMVDVEWDDDAHAGLCAEHPTYGEVRMLEADTGGAIRIFYVEEGLFRRQWVLPANLTPIPGTKIDLTPRREPEPESTPDHPAVLTTEEDYESAPTGTIVASDPSYPWGKYGSGFWRNGGGDEIETSSVMAHLARRVLRWGETL